MKRGIIIFSILIFSSACLFGQSWLWAKQGTCSPVNGSGCIPIAIAADKSGNVYETGKFWDCTLTFGSYNLTTSSNYAFIVKYDSNGNVLWAQKFRNVYTTAIATDPSGNVCITGQFDDTAIFGSIKLISTTATVFVAEFNPSGNVLWAKNPVNPTMYATQGNTIASDQSGNITIAGFYSGTLHFGNDSLPNNRGYDLFIAKYDPSGNFLWADEGRSNNGEFIDAQSICTDNNGNIYFTGNFDDTLQFGANTLYCADGDFYLVKYSPAGSVLWAKCGKANGFSQGVTYFPNGDKQSITCDISGGIYITGTFEGNLIIGPDTLKGGNSSYLAKYDPSGNFLWAQGTYGYSYSLSADKYGNIYYSGGFKDTVTVCGLKFNARGNNYGTYLVKLGYTGQPLCGTSIIDPIEGYVNESVSANPTGPSVYIGGPGFDTINSFVFDTLRGGYDGYPIIAKWECEITGINSIKSSNPSTILFPNPSNGKFTIQTKSDIPIVIWISNIEIYNMFGERVYSNTFSSNNSQCTIDISNQPSGIYLYRILSKDGGLIGEGKVIVQK